MRPRPGAPAPARRDTASRPTAARPAWPPPHVRKSLAGRRHRQEEGSFDQTVKKRSDDSDRLAAVIKRRREVGPAVAELARNLLHLRPGRHEHGHSSPLPHNPLYETIVQKLQRLLGKYIDPCCFRRIERARLQDLRGPEIVSIEGRIDRG